MHLLVLVVAITPVVVVASGSQGTGENPPKSIFEYHQHSFPTFSSSTDQRFSTLVYPNESFDMLIVDILLKRHRIIPIYRFIVHNQAHKKVVVTLDMISSYPHFNVSVVLFHISFFDQISQVPTQTQNNSESGVGDIDDSSAQGAKSESEMKSQLRNPNSENPNSDQCGTFSLPQRCAPTHTFPRGGRIFEYSTDHASTSMTFRHTITLPRPSPPDSVQSPVDSDILPS